MALNTEFLIRSGHNVATLPEVVNILREIRIAEITTMGLIFDLRRVPNSEALKSVISGALSTPDFGDLLARVSFVVDD